MPLYCWKCEVCGKEVEILRKFEESGDQPKKDDPDYPEECEHKWTKLLQTFRLTKGVTWGPGKGHWGRS